MHLAWLGLCDNLCIFGLYGAIQILSSFSSSSYYYHYYHLMYLAGLCDDGVVCDLVLKTVARARKQLSAMSRGAV